MRWPLVSMLVMMASSTASAAFSPCDYTVSYSSGSTVGRACFFEETPAGCPVRVLVPRPASQEVTVIRTGQGFIANTATVTNVGLLEQSYYSFEYLSCDCESLYPTAQFDLLEVDIPEAQPGDLVLIAGADIEIAPAGACPATPWPTEVSISTGGCDRCPNQDDPYGDGEDDDGGGCSSGHPVGLALALGLVALVGRRRRGR
jgi:MYXO-CTERM domain-containing protein